MRGKRAFRFAQTATAKLTAVEKTRTEKERKSENEPCNRRETEIEARGGWMDGRSEGESIANKRKQRVIDFCRGFARRYPLYPRLCGPAGDSRRRRWRQQRRRLRAVKRRRRAPRRRPPIGGCRPQGAALITRPCSTVSLSTALASKALYRASVPPMYAYLPIVYIHVT